MLAKHWPGVPIHEDVRSLTGEAVGHIDVITGGFPCQPFSLAGKRAGEEDDRHLWPEMYRLVAELRPAWVIGENVFGHISMGLDQVLSDLESLDYTCRPFVVPACAVDAPHRRDRLWIVADTPRDEQGRQEQRPERERVGAGSQSITISDSNGTGLEEWQGKNAGRSRANGGAFFERGFRRLPEPDMGGMVDGLPRKLHGDRLDGEKMDGEKAGATGNAGVDGMPGLRRDEQIAEASPGLQQAESVRGSMRPLPRQGRPAGRASTGKANEAVQDLRGDVLAEPQQETQHMQPGMLERNRTTQRDEAVGWTPEPEGIPRVAVGVKNRVDRLKSLGNTVVPQIPEIIGRAILMAEAK